MRRLSQIRLVLLLLAFCAVWQTLYAQDDPDNMPLGDVARNLRNKNVPGKPVIDDDNLRQVMERAEEGRISRSAPQFLMSGESKGFQMASPDATCSLSFTANVKSLLSGQYAQIDLPAEQLAKLQAQATIEGDALTVPVFNGTDWHLSELAVALTVIRKTSGIEADPLEQVRAEKKPDTTVIYRMRTTSPPWERAVFTAPLNLEIAPGEEWHWAIVQAKGYPPEGYAAQRVLNNPAAPVPVSLKDPEDPLAVTPLIPQR